MDLIKGIKERRSIRRFKSEIPSKEVIGQIVDAAIFAPSWKNSQVVRYTVIEDKELKNKIADAGMLEFISNTNVIHRSPVLVVQSAVMGRSGYERDGSFTTDKGDGWEMYDAGISAQTFCLAAHNYGLGTVIMGIFDDSVIQKYIALPENERITGLIALGYPDEENIAPKRKETAQILRFV